jgi:hypothetical protein
LIEAGFICFLVWHDLHSNLLQLSLDRQNEKTDGSSSSSTSSTSPVDEECVSSAVVSENDLSDTDWNQHSAHASRNGKLFVMSFLKVI